MCRQGENVWNDTETMDTMSFSSPRDQGKRETKKVRISAVFALPDQWASTAL